MDVLCAWKLNRYPHCIFKSNLQTVYMSISMKNRIVFILKKTFLQLEILY